MYNPSTGNSYSEQHARKMNQKNTNNSRKSFMIDRESYINFLEMQLEKVSSATLTVDSFAPKFEQLQMRVERLEDSIEKVNTLAKSTKQMLKRKEMSEDDHIVSLRSLLESDDDDKDYLTKWINRVVNQKIEQHNEVMEKKMKRFQKKLLAQVRIASQEHMAERDDNENELFLQNDTLILGKTNQKRRLHHHFHHYPDEPIDKDGGFSEEKMKLIDGFDRLFEEVQQLSGSVEKIKKEFGKLKSDTDTDMKKMKREVKYLSSHTNIDSIERDRKDICHVEKRVDSLDNQIQLLKDNQESFKETHDTKVLYRLTAIEERMKSDSDNTLQYIRKIEREVQQKMFDVNAVINEELESLKEARQEIMNGDPIYGDQHRATLDKNYEKMIDFTIAKRIEGIKQEIVSLLEQHQRDNKLYIEETVDRLHNNMPVSEHRVYADSEHDRRSQQQTFSKNRTVNSEEEGIRDNPHHSQSPYANSSSKNYNLNNNNLSFGPGASSERRKRLKELYKELAKLEMQEYSSSK